MPGLASIPNPGNSSNLSTAVPTNRAIQLYYTTQYAQLGIQLRDGSTADDTIYPNFYSAGPNPVGIILSDAQLTSAAMQSMNVVFGFTKKGESLDESKIDVSLLSPVFRKIDDTEETNKTISSCFSTDKTWIYFLTGTDSTDIAINEVEVGLRIQLPSRDIMTKPETGPTDALKKSGHKRLVLDLENVRVGSSLASYYNNNTSKRYVIYQIKKPRRGEDKSLYELDVAANTGTKIDTGNTALLTSIAVIYYSYMVWVFYTDENQGLRVIIKSGDKWGNSTAVEGAAQVDEFSQITAVRSNNKNHVFYKDTGGELQHLIY